MTPQRIQRKRSKGYRLPPDAIYVGRPSRWGNPFIVHAEEIVVHEDGRDWFCGLEIGGARQGAVDLHRDWITSRAGFLVDAARRELAGHDLACWCPPGQPCHADVLLELANR